jgi:hypothetical protein
MGLLDKLTGSRPGQPGIAPVPVAELRAALLAAADGQDWDVSDGTDHGCDLVAEFRIAAEQHGATFDAGLKTVFLIRMKFDQAAHEVRHNSQQSSASWRTGNSPGTGAQPAGLGYSFNSSDMTDPLRNAATSHGWGWQAAFKL